MFARGSSGSPGPLPDRRLRDERGSRSPGCLPVLALAFTVLRRLGVVGVEDRHPRLRVVERDRLAAVPAGAQKAVRRVDDDEGEAGVGQERRVARSFFRRCKLRR
jgi:hypothetical protein